ncbi:MAG: cupin domain-containing protein [Proteobacteria bacterium]|nr:cupin domain-containing protein [Pseudomonadota bacterium]
MELNADFAKRVVMHGDEIDWIDSPIPGIARRMLDRIGDEVARATTIVRYDPQSSFSPHVHTGGEEFIVLDGVFQDEHGDFPVGSYIRNPPQSQHTPSSKPGCTILVKLWQFDPDDRTQVNIDTTDHQPVPDATREGVSVIPLFKDARETVRIEQWEAGADVEIDTDGGAEIFVLDGGFTEQGDHLRHHSWLRIPIGGSVSAKANDDGTRVWIKSGHLRYIDPSSTALV